NKDNSVRWSLKEHNSWTESPNGPNCTKVGNGTPPPTTPTTPPKKVTVSKTTPTTKPAPAPKPVTKPAGTLAFTGFGAIGRLTTVLGAALVLIGLMVYFLDFRPATVWLLGRSGRSWDSAAARGTWFADQRARPPARGASPARATPPARGTPAARGAPPARATPAARGTQPRATPPARGPRGPALSSTRWGRSAGGRRRGR
ncbi:MAG TPA: hypothetical protein VLZ77_16730, partial [Acidimicrobiales bacterium]|nr:hypothetical protein [Acidimicrobiales bacterium]